MQSTINIDTSAFIELTGSLQRQVPFAVSKGINATLKDAQKDLTRALERKLDDPTPHTKRGIGIKNSTKRNLNGWVFIKDFTKQEDYLTYMVRPRKQDNIPQPVNIRVNKYGNIPSLRDGKKIKTLEQNPNYFVGTEMGVFGLWKRLPTTRSRTGGQIELVIALNQDQHYRQSRPFFPFYDLAERSILANMNRNINEALRHAISTANR